MAHTCVVRAARSRLWRVPGTYGDIIRSPSYFPLWTGQLLSSFGDTLHYIALVVLVFMLTGQGIAIAGVVTASPAPGVPSGRPPR